MDKKRIVVARKHYGAESLDLTIPVPFCKKGEVSMGDVFHAEMVIDKTGEEDIKFIYRRILKQK